MSGHRLTIKGWAAGTGVPAVGPTSGPAPGAPRREEPAVASLVPLARKCLARAGREPGPGVGLVLAVGQAIGATNEAHARAVAAPGSGEVSPRAFLYTTPNAVTARVSILLGLTGESLTLPDAAAPFWAAADLLAARRAQAVLVGGAEDGCAALLCVEPWRGPSDRGSALPRLELLPPVSGRPGPGPGLGEAELAAALVARLRQGKPGVFPCGRRGLLELNPPLFSSEDADP